MKLNRSSVLMLATFSILSSLLYVPANAQQTLDNNGETREVKLTKEQLLNAYTNQALAALDQKQFVKAAELYELAFAQNKKIFDSAYNAACAYALAGAKEQAFVWLLKAVEAGYPNSKHASRDTDLAGLHDDARWQPLLEKMNVQQKRQAKLWDSEVWKTAYREQLSEDERIAGLSKLWSEVKYNFVYTETLLDLDWDAVYQRYLPKVRAAKNTKEYYLILMEMCALLKDGHTTVVSPEILDDMAFALPPFYTRLIGDRVIITQVVDPLLREKGILPGVEILKVNGQDVKAYAQTQIAPYVSASTPQDKDRRVFSSRFLEGEISEQPELTLKNKNGKISTVKFQRVTYDQRKASFLRQPYSWRMLSGDIAYVALNSFGSNVVAESFLKDFDRIAKAKAIIFDIRENGGGNSNVGYRILSMLTNQRFFSSHAETRDYKPTYRAWGRVQTNFEFEPYAIQPDNLHQFSGKVVVLTSASTYSAAEDFAVAFDTMKRGKMIGEPTGGSTGQPLMISLPGGGIARICTKKDTYADGKPFVGVGVQPDKLVRLTVEDFRSERDPVLDAALAELR